MNKHDEYQDWLKEKLEQVYDQAWTDGKRSLINKNSEEYEYIKLLCINSILKDA